MNRLSASTSSRGTKRSASSSLRSNSPEDVRAPKQQKQRESVLDIKDAIDDYEDPRKVRSTLLVKPLLRKAPLTSIDWIHPARRRNTLIRGRPLIHVLKAENDAVRIKPPQVLLPNSSLLDKTGNDDYEDEGEELTAQHQHRVTRATRQERINRLIYKYLAKNCNAAQRRRPRTRDETTRKKIRQFVTALSNAKKVLLQATSQLPISFVSNKNREVRREINNAMKRTLKPAMSLPWEMVQLLTRRLLKQKPRTNMDGAGPEAEDEVAEGEGADVEAYFSITKTRATPTTAVMCTRRLKGLGSPEPDQSGHNEEVNRYFIPNYKSVLLEHPGARASSNRTAPYISRSFTRRAPVTPRGTMSRSSSPPKRQRSSSEAEAQTQSGSLKKQRRPSFRGEKLSATSTMGKQLLQKIANSMKQCKEEGLYHRNANLKNWIWNDKIKKGWERMGEEKGDLEGWQKFSKRWYGHTERSLNDSGEPQTLSLEHLPTGIVNAMTIFERDVYKTMFEYVWVQGLGFNGQNGCIITGQSGTGKSSFQIYLLVRLLQLKQIVLFSPDGAEFYLFFGDKVYFSQHSPTRGMLPKPKSSENVFIWSLFDIHKIEEPTPPLYTLPCCPVQTASPNQARYQKWREEYSPLFLGMPLWTEDELRKGLPCQRWYPCLLETLRVNPNDPLDRFPGARDAIKEHIRTIDMAKQRNPLPVEATIDALMQASILKFGNAARDVFGAMKNFKDTITKHKGAVASITYDQLKTTAMLLESNTMFDIPNGILALSPTYSDTIFSSVEWKIRFKSEWIAEMTLDRLDDVETTELCWRYLLFANIAEASPLAGHFFERLVHNIITKTSGATSWPLIRMDSDNNTESPVFTLSNGASTNSSGKKELTFTPNNVTFATATMYSSCAKAKRVLGYRPEVGVQEGLEKTIEWWKSQVDAGRV